VGGLRFGDCWGRGNRGDWVGGGGTDVEEGGGCVLEGPDLKGLFLLFGG
jgi:hypothetical protein